MSSNYPRLQHRPWINNSTLTIFNISSVLTFDCRAFRGTDGTAYFSTHYHARNRLIAGNAYMLDALGQLVELNSFSAGIPETAKPLYWTRDSHHIFRYAHPALRKLWRQPIEGVTYVAAYFHYVPTLDVDPWPRTMANGYTYQRKHPRNRLRASDAKPDAEVNHSAPVRAILPDLL